MMKFSKVAAPALAAVAMAVAGIGQANAASYSQSISFASGTTNYDNAQSFSLFDSSAYGGATLDSVVITYAFGDTGGTFKGTASGGKVTLSNVNVFDAVSLDLYSNNYSSTKVVDSANGAATLLTTSQVLLAGSSTATVNVAGTSVSGTKTYTLADLAFFIGSGTSWLDATASSSTSGGIVLNGNASFSGQYSSIAAGSATITYNYTPVSTVPEPESYAMLLAGLAAIGVVARRRRLS